MPRTSSHVLIVDDEPSICWGLQRLLTEEGYRVSVAGSAEEALACAAEARPDLVMLDVRLPGLDGLSAMPRLRELIGPVPMIVMTAFGDLQTAVTAVQNGAVEYLTKPFDLDQAAEVVEAALRRGLLSDSADDPPLPSQMRNCSARDRRCSRFSNRSRSLRRRMCPC